MSSLKKDQLVEILLVEDNAGDIRLMEEALKEIETKHHLSVIKDGVDVLAFLRNEEGYQQSPRPDLIFLDLNLPKKDGREVLNEVKNDPDLKRIPIIVFTTSNREEDILETYNSHANCFIDC